MNKASGCGKNHLEPLGFQVVFHWILLGLLALSLAACEPGRESSGNPPADLQKSTTDASLHRSFEGPVFEDKGLEAGLDFSHQNGATGELLLSEIVGSGVAFLDYDQDGDLDVYLVQDGVSKSAEGRVVAADGTTGLPSDRLFRNELMGSGGTAGRPDTLRFVDVTEESGIAAHGAGMGVAVGDIDNDGCYDLYILNRGPNQLWRNRCDGTFEDVTEHAGVGDPRWGVSASFLDIDADGFLDIYIANYVFIPPGENRACSSPSGIPEYCSPQVFSPEFDTLFRNLGDGTFEDVSESSGIRRVAQNGLGVVSRDFSGDAMPDLYVANDMTPNFLWINQGDGTFQDFALLSGSAVNRHGRSEASMGVAVGDVDWDGDEDVFITHLSRESHTLYRNRGGLSFEDDTPSFGLESLTNESTGFGTHFFDYDNDGWLDIIVCSGAVTSTRRRLSTEEKVSLEQPNQLYRNSGNGTFLDVSETAGEGITAFEVSRGLALGDVDNDGDSDLLLTNNGGRPRLLINQVGSENHWLGFRVFDHRTRRDALGARVRLVLEDGRTKSRTIGIDGSYASSSDPRVLFGLGSSPGKLKAEVIWPDGWVQSLAPPALDRYVLVERRESVERSEGSTAGEDQR